MHQAEVRHLGLRDGPLLQQMAEEFYLSGLSEAAAREILQSKTSHMICALVEGRPVGFCYYHMLPKWYRNIPEIFIYDIEVLEEERRKGWATRMFEQVYAEARRRSIEKIWLLVRRKNEAALGFYRAMGGRVRQGDLCITFEVPDVP